MTSATSSPRPPRNPVLLTIDIVASVLLLIFAAVLALGVITTAIAYFGLTTGCGAGPYEGLTCNATVLAVVNYGMIVVAVLAGFLGFGFVIVNLIRRRYTVLWPVGAIVVMIATVWLGSLLAGQVAP